MNRHARNRPLRWLSLAAAVIALSAPADAQTLGGAVLANALRQGGYVLVVRHANSPAALPDKATADAANVKLERQLDTVGQDQAREFGEGVKAARLPVGDVYSSPTYRALETVRLASLGTARTFAELDEGAQGMQSNADAARSAWLRAKAAEMPRARTDTIIVTHAPNIGGAFGAAVSDVAAGETLVFRPDGRGAANLVARIKVKDWPLLAK